MSTKEDRRGWSFQRRALAELADEKRHHKPKHRRKFEQDFRADIELANGQVKSYQFSSDIRHAIATARQTQQPWRDYLIGSLIVVPVGNYNAKGRAPMSVGLIKNVYPAPHHTHNSRWITRGQFVKAPKPGCWRALGRAYHYLKHDYDELSQHDIAWALQARYADLMAVEMALVICALILAGHWLLS